MALPLGGLDPVRVVVCASCGETRQPRAVWWRGGLLDEPLGVEVCGPCAEGLAREVAARGGVVVGVFDGRL